MTPAQYLDAAKAELAISADNELAKRFDTTRQRISAYRNGSVWPDNYIVMKLAITLKLDPAMVLADLESQREKNHERAEFWRSFLSRAALLVLIACTLASSFIATSGTEAAQLGGILTASAAVFYAAWVRIIWVYVSFRLSQCGKRLIKVMKKMQDFSAVGELRPSGQLRLSA